MKLSAVYLLADAWPRGAGEVTIPILRPERVLQTLDVPWLGSGAASMEWYNREVQKFRPLFSQVNSITWGNGSDPTQTVV